MWSSLKERKIIFFVFWRRFQCGRRLMIANEIANIYHYWRLEKSRGLFINKTRKKFKLFRSLFLRPCLHGVGDPGLVGLVSLVFTLWGTQTKETYPTRPGSPTPCKQGLSCPATQECFPLMLTFHCNYLLMHNVTTSNNTIGTNVHTRKQALAD